MLESLQENLGSALKSLSGKGKLTEANMREGLRSVQQALLEADVSYPVVKDFMEKVTEQATGEAVLRVFNPTKQVIDIVHKELINLMGPVDPSISMTKPLTILMLCGLQGAGKTTTCGKLAKLLQSDGKRPMLVAADLQRPAAIHQLQVLGESLGVPVHVELESADPVAVCRRAVDAAKKADVDVLILDTAGRLHVDEELMGQLEQIDRKVKPDQIYFVVDSMTGQDAVNSAKVFNDALELDGVILTKLDGDTRGGAALSVKSVTGVPIKFIGTGETLDGLEPFYADRMAGRILGMGDMLSLIEQTKDKFDEEEMKRQEERLRKGEFGLDDFRRLMDQMKRMGSFGKMMGMIPGMGAMAKMVGDDDVEHEMKRFRGIIDSMTPAEKQNPKTIDPSRRKRIAAGAGVQPHQVNELLKQFEPMAAMMKTMGKGGRGSMAAMQKMANEVMQNPQRGMKKSKQRPKKLSPKEKAKLAKERARAKRKGKK